MEIPPEVHEPFINRGPFEKAAFSLFLIAQLNAIEPLYGEHALRFCTIEAGLIAQLLETEGPRQGIGLCQIGWLDFDRIRDRFLLDEGHRFIHCLIGGPMAADAPVALQEREEGEV
jgi:hypothetical protein